MSEIDVAVLAGSNSDSEIVEKVTSTLDEERISYEVNYISAHREPEKLRAYVKENDSRIKIYICIAGLAAALPGVVASYTSKPVIGVPVSAKLGGLDALLSIVQTPAGVPVAAVGIDNGRNAALLAKRILDLAKSGG
ncbi:MAG: 5-(carboxyamino)imidazole ribonucleotide mutase [Candidatus Odinarchaeum yellowstonii]|uniref:N5-carboxyaminoimidazole ribonucleotide mutase n=1 Tax=Odinarchaeota yellowstonii (strain LCB_4) TaxID=1841599 RepID=A0AAF0D258_ODILC|nr:MAG: 5-(carboxyamino)imidazole ribonucleotide mutase [Candidatus Odinarchaeum yellowstonii]